ncbi:unnamed protein product [Sympodiomycopsis kandeliae]
MQLPKGLGSSSRRASPDRHNADPTADSADPAIGKTPKRSGSFGKGLGSALANSMTRATEGLSLPGVGKKPTSSAVHSPALTSPNPAGLEGSKEYPFGVAASTGPSANGAQLSSSGLSAAAAAHASPDPSHLQNFALRLSELVNQAWAPTVAHHQSGGAGGVASSVAKHAPGRSNIPAIDQIIYEGKKLPSRAKIQELAQLLVTELRYAKSVDTYFLRAASRAALKALTLFASRMDSLLVPVAKDPTSLVMPSTAKEGVHISPALEYNLGVATLTWIVEDALERCIEGDDDDPANYEGMPAFVSEILTPVRKRMETTILHVIQPVLTGVKTSLSASLLKGTRYPFIAGGSPALTPSISNESPQPPLSPMPGVASAFNSPKATDLSAAGTVATSANWLKELQGRLEGSRKLLAPRIEARTSQDGEGWYISVAVHLIWKGLFVLTSRPIEGKASAAAAAGGTTGGKGTFFFPSHSQQSFSEAGKRSPNPVQLTAALKSVASVGGSKASRGDSAAAAAGSDVASGRATPSVAAGAESGLAKHEQPGPGTPGAIFTGGGSILPTKSAMAAASKATMLQLSDLQTFQKMALRFCKGFVSDKALAAVAAELSRADAAEDVVEGDQDLQEEDEEDELARQALAEALEALNSTIAVIQAMEFNFAGVRAALDRGCGHSPLSEVRQSQETGHDGRDKTQKPFNSKPAGLQAKALDPLQLRALRAIPPLLLLHLAYARLPTSVKLPGTASNELLSTPPALFGLSWQEYERSIAGFVGGSSWAQAAVQRWDKEITALWRDLATRQDEAISRRQGRLDHPKVGQREQEEEDTEAAEETINADVTLNVNGATPDAEDLGTTPTQHRPGPAAVHIHGGRQQPLSRSGSTASKMSGFSSASTNAEEANLQTEGQSEPILDASQATPRATVDVAMGMQPKKKSRSRFGLRLGRSSSRTSSRSGGGDDHRDDVSEHLTTPDGSPPLVATPGKMDDLESPVSGFSIGAPAQHAQHAPSSSTSSGGKSRFWRSSSSSSSSNAVSPSGSASQSPSLGAIALPTTTSGKSSSGFRMPSVSRSGLSRTSSPVGVTSGADAGTSSERSAASGPRGVMRGIRSESTTSLKSSTSQQQQQRVSSGSSSLHFDARGEEIRLHAETELIEIEKSQDALLFFAKVLEWAAWSGGFEYKCKLDNE